MPKEKTLFPVFDPSDDNEPNPLAIDFLRLYQQHFNTYSDKIIERQDLEDNKETVAKTDNPKVSNKRTNTSLPHKVMYNFLKKLDIPGIKMIANMSETERAITLSLLEDALEKAGWRNVLTNKKSGAQREYITLGDAVIGFGSNPDAKFPFTFFNVDFSRIGTNADANQFFAPGSEGMVRKFVCVKEYQNTQFFSMFPEAKGKVTPGSLPTINNDGQLDEKETDQQKLVTVNQRTQVAFCYDLDYQQEGNENGLYMIFAGRNLGELKKVEGKAYPFRDRDGDTEIPYDVLTCFTRTKGFVNYGLFQIIFKLGEMHSTLENMGITYTLSNSNPVRIVSTTQSATEFGSDMARAQKFAKEGKMPIMLNKDGKEFGGVTTLQTQPIIDEMNGILSLLERDLQQMGVNINDIATDTTKTLGALQLEVAASTDLIRYIQRENAPAFERLVQMFVNSLIERKKDDSDIELISNAKIRNDQGDTVEAAGVPQIDALGEMIKKGKTTKIARNFTLEDLKEMLRKGVDIEIVGGVQNNPVLEDQTLRDLIATSDPSSKASAMARSARAKNFGFNYEPEDFAPGGGQQQQQQIPKLPAAKSPAI